MADTTGPIETKLTLDGAEFFITLRRAGDETKKFESIFSKAFGRLPAPVRRVAEQVRTFTSGSLGRLRTGLDHVSSSIGKVSRGFFSIRAAIGVAATAFGAFKITNFAADLQNTEESFRRLINTLGSDSTTALRKFQSASKNTISDFQVMRSVNQAVILGVAANVEQFEKLIDAARRLGKVTGRTTAEGIRDLSIGIGRQSRLVLDNLGLIVSVDEANQAYADSVGKTVGQLSLAERRTAFLNESLRAIDVRLEQIGDNGLNFADVLNRLRSIAGNFAADLARSLTPALQKLLEALSGLAERFRGIANVFGQIASGVIGSLTSFIEENGEKIVEIIGSVTSLVGKLVLTLAQIARSTSQFVVDLVTDPLGAIQKRFDAFFGNLLKAIGELGKAAGLAFAEAILDQLAASLSDIFIALSLIRIPGVGSIPGLSEAGESLSKTIKDAKSKLETARSDSVDSGRRALGDTFLAGILGITPEQRDELRRQFKIVDELTVNFVAGLQQAARGPDITTEQASEAFEKIKAVLKTTSEDLARTTGDFVTFRDLLQTLRVAESAGTFKVEGVDAQEFERATAIIEGAIQRRNALIEEEAAAAKQRFEDNKQLQSIIDDVVESLREVQDNIRLVNLPEEERALAQLEDAFKRRLENLTLADPDQIQEAQRQIARLISLSRFVNEREAERLRLLQEAEEARKREVEATEAASRVTAQLNNEIRNANLDRIAGVLGIDDADERQLLDLIETISAEIDKIELVKPEEASRLRQLLDAAIKARREVLALEAATRASQDRAEAAGIVGDLQREADSLRLTPAEAAIERLRQEVAEREFRINQLKIDPKEKQRFIEELNDAASEIEIKIKEDAAREAVQPIVDSLTGSFEAVGQSLASALQSGESAARAIANALASQLSAGISSVVSQIGTGLSEVFKTVFAGINEQASKTLGGILSIAIGIIGSIISRAQESGSSFQEADIDDLATSQSVVRGVVAGPTSIPIGEVSTSLKEAFRPTEDLLRSILEAVRERGGALGDPLGAGQGALTT